MSGNMRKLLESVSKLHESLDVENRVRQAVDRHLGDIEVEDPADLSDEVYTLALDAAFNAGMNATDANAVASKLSKEYSNEPKLSNEPIDNLADILSPRPRVNEAKNGEYGIYNRASHTMMYTGMSREEAYAWMETDSRGSEGIATFWDGDWWPTSGGEPIKPLQEEWTSTFDRWATDSMRAVYDSALWRIQRQHTHLLAKHGPEKVQQAIESAAEFYGERDLDEIGSSDISAYVNFVYDELGEDYDAWLRSDESVNESESDLAQMLKAIQAKSDKLNSEYRAKGFGGVGDAPQVNAFEPNSDFPAPWRAAGRPSEPWTIYADNNKQVVSWLRRDQAEEIVALANASLQRKIKKESKSFKDYLDNQ